jgi:catechol 2,3-dioxygenase-like lactoylglutathione lyase family enzyme
MIIPNLMVTDLGRSVAFYRDVLGFSLSFVIGPDQIMQDDPTGGVFATLERDGAQLMLQTRDSLAAELPVFQADQPIEPAGTIYLRGVDPDPVIARANPESIVKQPFRQWYGMREAYIRDPDGHILCLGVPDGPPPG